MQSSTAGPVPEKSATRFRRALLDWYAIHARDLPFRRTRDPYRIYLAEIMLQQTRVEQGLPFYERFLERFPSIEHVAVAPEEAVLKAWEGLGYYARARNLHRCARMLVHEHGGSFPEEAESLLRLPGIGRYTAGAIASIAFGRQAPVLDGNVKRVLARVCRETDPVGKPAAERRLWAHASALVPPDRPGDFNQALMELGARICLPRMPRCGECPVAGHCVAHIAGIQETLPARAPARTVPHHEIAVAVICRNGKYLIGKRPPDGLLGGLWEFPGGKIRPGEPVRDALVRECREALGVRVKVGEPVAVVKHAYTHFRVTLHVHRCATACKKITPAFHRDIQWVSPQDFDRYVFPKANHKFLRLLAHKKRNECT